MGHATPDPPEALGPWTAVSASLPRAGELVRVWTPGGAGSIGGPRDLLAYLEAGHWVSRDWSRWQLPERTARLLERLCHTWDVEERLNGCRVTHWAVIRALTVS